MVMTEFEQLARNARKVRDDVQATDVDIVLSDGTVLRQKGDSAECLKKLDEIIAFAETYAAICPI
jgi:hypothetical protein